MAIRSLSTIINDLVNYLKAKRPSVPTFVGTTTRDIIIEAPAQEFDRVYQELEHTQQLQSIEYASSMSTSELDDLAVNYGLVRLTGTQASGTITFQIRNFSTSSSTVTIPIGTVVATQGSDTIPQVSFVTTQAVTFTPSQAPSYFNPTTGLYERNGAILASSIGSASNVGAGTITKLISSVPGIDSVNNFSATTGGTDIESNEAFAARIQTKLSGNNIGTPNGIVNLIRTNSNVLDATVVTPNDSEMLRNEFGGEVDVYIVGESVASTSDTFLYSTTASQSFVPLHQPVRSITSVMGLAGSSPRTFVLNTDYSFVTDTTTLFNGSVFLQNRIVFNIGGTNPDNGTVITVNYTYNQLVESLQALVDDNSNHIVASDILIKEASRTLIDTTVDISLIPGYQTSTVTSAVQTAISTYINNLGLGDNIDKSDIVFAIEDVDGVDQVNLDTLTLEKNGVALSSTEQRLKISKTEYPRTDTITVNIV